MKKKFAVFTCLLMLIFCFSFQIHAANTHVMDDLGYLTSAQLKELEQQADDISEKFDTDVLVLFVSQQGYSSNYARDYVESYGETYYPDGYIAYIVNMADRSYWIDAYGSEMREVFTQSMTDKLSEIAYEDLREGKYYESAKDVLREISNQLEIHSTPLGFLKKVYLYPGTTLMITGLSAGAALITALIWTAIKSSYHKDKGEKVNAEGYGGNFVLSQNSDQFIRHYQTRAPRPKPQQSSGRSGGFGGGGGGGGHTGSGGHF